MRLIHTLLFLFRKEQLAKDVKLASICLRSLEKSTCKSVVIYNQGYLTNEEVEQFVSRFDLECIIIGNGENVGTVVGRQSCFEWIWENRPDTEYISETHLDMVFTHNWEDALISYLDTHDEPMVSCGIVDQNGNLSFIDMAVDSIGYDSPKIDEYLNSLKCDKVVHGFTNPCIHVSSILKEAGGYNARFLTGKQAFEDDSMLLSYYYYYGTKANWKPKVSYNSVVYHAVAGQRLSMGDSVNINYSGLIRQYGVMGLKHLSMLHKSPWHINFFGEQYRTL